MAPAEGGAAEEQAAARGQVRVPGTSTFFQTSPESHTGSGLRREFDSEGSGGTQGVGVSPAPGSVSRKTRWRARCAQGGGDHAVGESPPEPQPSSASASGTAADRGLLSSLGRPFSSLSLGVPVWAMVWVGLCELRLLRALCLSGSGHFPMNTLRILPIPGATPHRAKSVRSLCPGVQHLGPGPSWLGVRR